MATGQAHPYIHEGTQPKRNVGQTSSPFHAILLSAAREDHTRRPHEKTERQKTTQHDTTRHNATADSTHTHTLHLCKCANTSPTPSARPVLEIQHRRLEAPARPVAAALPISPARLVLQRGAARGFLYLVVVHGRGAGSRCAVHGRPSGLRVCTAGVPREFLGRACAGESRTCTACSRPRRPAGDRKAGFAGGGHAAAGRSGEKRRRQHAERNGAGCLGVGASKSETSAASVAGKGEGVIRGVRGRWRGHLGIRRVGRGGCRRRGQGRGGYECGSSPIGSLWGYGLFFTRGQVV